MSIRILALINIALFLVSLAFSLREPLAGIAIKAITVLVDFVAFLAILVQGQFSDFGFRDESEIDRDTDPMRYIAGLFIVLLMGFMFGGLPLLINGADNWIRVKDFISGLGG